ncbi:MAG: hypothetical protein ACK559_20340, partial [bacterium]
MRARTGEHHGCRMRGVLSRPAGQCAGYHVRGVRGWLRVAHEWVQLHGVRSGHDEQRAKHR